MGLADLVKKKLAKGEKIIIEEERALEQAIEDDEKSIGQALAHLHPHIHHRKDQYQQWVQNAQPQIQMPRSKGVDLIASHTGANPLTGLQGTADLAAMKKITRAKAKPKPRPKPRHGPH